VFKKVLQILSLLDQEDHLSISNLIVLGLFFVVAVKPEPNWALNVSFLAATLNYCHKRFESTRYLKVKNQSNQEIQEKVDELESKVSALSINQSFKRK
jgi:hypothetical protein